MKPPSRAATALNANPRILLKNLFTLGKLPAISSPSRLIKFELMIPQCLVSVQPFGNQVPQRAVLNLNIGQ
jgi:hypothetical protein